MQYSFNNDGTKNAHIDELFELDVIKPFVSQFKEKGNFYYKQANYKQAISSYSRGILRLDRCCHKAKSIQNLKFNKDTEHYKEYTQMLFNLHRAILMNNRAQCYRKVNKYDKALRDLNWIISISKTEHGTQISWIVPMIPHCTKALLRRADIFLKLGNSVHALFDYTQSTIKPFIDSNGFAKQWLLKLGNMKHPSPQTLINCNKLTMQGNIFNKQWIKVQRSDNSEPLPFKYGHSMIVHNNTIYCFGGKETQYGSPEKPDALFYKIIIHHQNDNKYCYKWNKLPFTRVHEQYINPYNSSWSKLVSIHKWNNKLLLFGGNNPFNNMLEFDFTNETWHKIISEKITFKAPKHVDNHAAIIMNNKLYVHG
eukprot:497600_1